MPGTEEKVKSCISAVLPLKTYKILLSLGPRHWKNAKSCTFKIKSPICDECQTQPANVLALPRVWCHRDDSNDTPQTIWESQSQFPFTSDQDKPV